MFLCKVKRNDVTQLTFSSLWLSGRAPARPTHSRSPQPHQGRLADLVGSRHPVHRAADDPQAPTPLQRGHRPEHLSLAELGPLGQLGDRHRGLCLPLGEAHEEGEQEHPFHRPQRARVEHQAHQALSFRSVGELGGLLHGAGVGQSAGGSKAPPPYPPNARPGLVPRRALSLAPDRGQGRASTVMQAQPPTPPQEGSSSYWVLIGTLLALIAMFGGSWWACKRGDKAEVMTAGDLEKSHPPPAFTPKTATSQAQVDPSKPKQAIEFDSNKASTWTQADRVALMKQACFPDGLCYPGQIFSILESTKTPKEKAELTKICLDMKNGFVARARELHKQLVPLEARARTIKYSPGNDKIDQVKVEWVKVDEVRKELNKLNPMVPGVGDLRVAAGDVRSCFYQQKDDYISECNEARKYIAAALKEMAEPQREYCAD